MAVPGDPAIPELPAKLSPAAGGRADREVDRAEGGGRAHGAAQAELLVHRLRAWPKSSWRHGNRTEVTRRALQRLADLASAGPTGRRVPDAGWHALVDQFVVLHADAVRAGVAPTDLEELVTALQHDLGLPDRRG